MKNPDIPVRWYIFQIRTDLHWYNHHIKRKRDGVLSLHERQVECGNFSRKGPIVKEKKRHIINYIVFNKWYSYLKRFSVLHVYKEIQRKTYSREFEFPESSVFHWSLRVWNGWLWQEGHSGIDMNSASLLYPTKAEYFSSHTKFQCRRFQFIRQKSCT